MNRRNFSKLMALFAGAPLIRKEREMPRLGDLLAEIASGGRLSPSEIEQVRRQTNETYSLARRVNDLADVYGGIQPNLFSGGAPLSVLPHEAAGVDFSSTTGSSVAHGVGTTIDFVETESAGNQAVWYEYGMRRDFANNRIEIHGTPGKSLFAICGWFTFDIGSTAMGLQLQSGSGASAWLAYYAGMSALGGQVLPFFYIREAVSADDWYSAKAYWNGGAGSSEAVHGSFNVVRLR